MPIVRGDGAKRKKRVFLFTHPSYSVIIRLGKALLYLNELTINYLLVLRSGFKNRLLISDE